MTYFSRVPKIETWQDWRIHHFRMWVRCFRFWGIHVLNWYVPQTIFSYSKFSKGDSSKLIWETIESHCPLRALLWNIGWQLLVDKESSEEIQSTLWTIAPSHVPSAGGKWEKLGCFILLQWYTFLRQTDYHIARQENLLLLKCAGFHLVKSSLRSDIWAILSAIIFYYQTIRGENGVWWCRYVQVSDLSKAPFPFCFGLLSGIRVNFTQICS